jgi:hypothetical protein
VHITYEWRGDGEVLLDAGANPPDGVLITFYLPDAGDARLTIADAAGQEIATVREGPTEGGMHRVTWDMRYPPPVLVEGATFWEESGAAGPLAAPGTYAVRLEVGSTVLTQQFEVVPDPRVAASSEDLQEQLLLLLAIRDRLSETHMAANRIAALRQSLAELRTRRDIADVTDLIDRVDAELASIDHELIERTSGLNYANPIRLNAKLAALSAGVGSADWAPTRQSREVFADLSSRVADQLARLDRVVKDDLAELESTLRALEVPFIELG